MTRVLIGSTGFVGGALKSIGRFDLLIHRANLSEIEGRHCEAVVCAGLPARKWLANREPVEDLSNMQALCRALDSVSADRFTLVSTIDVYPVLDGGDEGFDCESLPNHAYGSHRLMFERYVRQRFRDALILRLPALFGAGLRKNVLFDLLNDNDLDAINPESRFQWYPVARVAADMVRAELLGLKLVNLFTEPLDTQAIVQRWFPGKRIGGRAAPAVRYDLRSRHADLFGGQGGYVMSAADVLRDMGSFIEATRAGA